MNIAIETVHISTMNIAVVSVSMVQSSPWVFAAHNGENTFTQAHLRVNGAVFSADGSLLLAMARIPSHKLIPVSMVQSSPLMFLCCS